MYKMQVIDALTYEMLREQAYETVEPILGLIDCVKKGNDCFLYDDALRLNKAEYITHYSVKEQGAEVYKLFLQVELVEMQEPVHV